MPSVTHDGRSFSVDGRRVWLVSGRIPYARVPRSQWAERIHAAKQAGLNCVETPIFWNRHETRPGRFDFVGENDLRHFVDLVGKAGMYCILGIGPYVGCDWDMGGLPAFLHEIAPREGVRIAYRTNNQQFLEACSRFIGAVADQVRGWQVTAPGTGGPIILLQCESEWTCGDDTKAAQYLGELTRYIRESGLSVPIVNSNDLWQQVEGQIDSWSGSDNMLAMMRQLTTVRPGHPRLVIDFATGHQAIWGREAFPIMAPRSVERRLAELLAGGGQVNITTFCGGINPGFSGARTDDGLATYATHRADDGCVLDQTGAQSALYPSLRRVAMLASRFGKVFSHLDPSFKPVIEKPQDPAGSSQDQATKKSVKGKSRGKSGAKAGTVVANTSVVHATGAQGGAAFVFGPEEEHDQPLMTTLLLGDGTELPVPLGQQVFACCLLDVNISPRVHVDYCNLTPLGHTINGGSGANGVGTVLVLYGPAGSRGMLSINGSPVEVNVPDDEKPGVLVHEGVAMVIVRSQDTEHVAIADDVVYVGASALSASTPPQPILAAGFKQVTRIGPDGKAKAINVDPPRRVRSDVVEHGPWSAAPQDDYIHGESARYAAIQSLTELSTLGAAHGYAWYRFSLANPKSGKVTLDVGTGGDRFHLFLDGKSVGMIGRGPGADTTRDINLRKGAQTLVILAENLGRFASGVNLGEQKGLIDDLFTVRELTLSKPVQRSGAPIPLLSFKTPLWDVAEGDTTVPERMAMNFKHSGDAELLLHIAQPPSAGLLLLNDQPIRYLDRSGPACVVLPEDRLKQGANTLEITVVNHEQVDKELALAAKSMSLSLVEGGLANQSEIAFAKWEPPAGAGFVPIAKAKNPANLPIWFKCEFEVPKSLLLGASGGANGGGGGLISRGLFFEPDGLTKGQFFINGKHVGRYFVAIRGGKPVVPQSRYYIPPNFVRDGMNEFMIFDEDGGVPTRAKLFT